MLSAPRAKIAKILREIQALPTQILRECDAKRTTFSTPNTPPTRSSTAPTSCGCRNDAVQILGALTSKTQQICKLFATDPQIFERKNVHELGAERAILQRQTLRRFKRELCPRPTSRAAHDRYTKCMLSAPRAKIAKILREIQALPTQILRESDARRTAFLDAKHNTDSM